jgi:hypothetical protein
MEGRKGREKWVLIMDSEEEERRVDKIGRDLMGWSDKVVVRFVAKTLPQRMLITIGKLRKMAGKKI